jgi:hypothetical protein
MINEITLKSIQQTIEVLKEELFKRDEEIKVLCEALIEQQKFNQLCPQTIDKLKEMKL